MTGKLTSFFKLIKIEHSLFSLPLLFAGAYLGADGWPKARVLALVVAVGVSGRTIALILNRVIDREIDRRNPRTLGREIPSGKISTAEALSVAALFLAVYIGGCVALGPWPLRLSPVPLGLFILYPYMKQFTWLCHSGIGLTFAVAALGGWVAASGRIDADADILCLAGFVLIWAPAFDILYALADLQFDASEGVHSVPARWGAGRAVVISRVMHAVAFLFLVGFCLVAPAGPAVVAAVAVAGALLLIEAIFVARFDKLFLPVNAAISLLLLIMAAGGGAL